MKHLISILLLLALISCGEDKTVVAPNNDNLLVGSIRGTLTDIGTNEPIAGAFIKTSPLSSTTKSNDDGTFYLETIGPELYDIIITHEDYIEFKDKIRVSAGITNNIEFQLISRKSLNNPPNVPNNIYPQEKSKVGSKEFRFRWEATDPDNDTLVYDLYFGLVKEELELIASNIKEKYFDFKYELKEDTQYYWQVIAKDKYSQREGIKTLFTFKERLVVDLPDLVANWKFDGNAEDSGINAHDGTEQNVLYVEDRDDNALSAASFNGITNFNSKILISNEIQLKNEFTIAMWIKPDPSLGENSNGYFDIVSKWGSGKPLAASWAFGINNKRRIFLGTYSSSSTFKETTALVTPSQWTHIAVTFKNGIATFYYNGVQESVQSGMQIPQTSIINLSIGGRADQLSSYHGVIDDLYIFSRELDENEVLSLMEK